MIVRLAKAACASAVALFMALVAFGNITDYGTNFAYVERVLEMDGVQGKESIAWRAVTSPALHAAAYAAIIATEIAVAILILLGALAMLGALTAEAKTFKRAKTLAVLGLTLGFVLYEGGFIAIAGEWFAMWRSTGVDSVQSAFRIAVTMLGVLIFISLKDEDLG